MVTFPEVSIEDLENAYTAWPGDDYSKGRLRALILRVRIERAAAALPRNVVTTRPDTSYVERRLYLSIGAPHLTIEEQSARTAVVIAAVGAYKSICDLLHGRNYDPNPPLQEVAAWISIVDALETDLGRGRSAPYIGRLPAQTALVAPVS